jgi:glutathione S-transferase
MNPAFLSTQSIDLSVQFPRGINAELDPVRDRILYELAGRDDRRFSPYCWRTRFALAHKGLDAHMEPVRFTEKEKLGFSNQKLVPVLVDFGEVITDSWEIAKYIEDSYYPERSLMLGGGTKFFNTWVDTQLHPAIFKCIVADICDHVAPEDRDYFRETREARLGKTMEAMLAERPEHEQQLQRTLLPLRELLRKQPFVSGKAPAYADYIAFGAFQWARCSSPFKFLDDADPIALWKKRMVRLYGSLANSVPHYA